MRFINLSGRAVSADGARVKKVHGNYHIPISNTATGLLALEVA